MAAPLGPAAAFDFRGWDYLDATLAPLVDRADTAGTHGWVDVFGNHDVWASGYPLTRLRGHRSVMRSLGRPRPDRLAEAMPSRFAVDWPLAGGRQLEVFRASSVPPDWWSAVRGSGQLTPHPLGEPLPLTMKAGALRELRAAARAGRTPGAVRILALHHPVHAFESSWLQEQFATTGFKGRDSLARLTGQVPFSLVLAGHRHKLDPAEDSRYDAFDLRQPPLPQGIGQLVAESPTTYPVPYLDIQPADAVPNSFSLYRLLVDDERQALRVDRTVFRQGHPLAAQPFAPGPEETAVLSNLRLE